MKNKIRNSAVLAGILCASLVRADTLVLENHRELTGDVQKTDTEYVIKLRNGITTRIPISDVAEWN
jgi:hypothetical protein